MIIIAECQSWSNGDGHHYTAEWRDGVCVAWEIDGERQTRPMPGKMWDRFPRPLGTDPRSVPPQPSGPSQQSK